MQVTETVAEGLKHEFQISVPAADLDAKADARLVELKDKIRLNGFRPGKVPVAHLKKVYGKSIMAEVVQEAINEANKQIIDENGLRLAQEPKVELPEDQATIEAALQARGDLSYKVALEVLPKFEIGAFDDLALDRPVAEVAEEDVATAIDRLADNRRTYAAKAEGAKAENGDQLTIDFVGSINGEPFEGGSSKDIKIVLGSNAFIPGFEEQLIGVAVGEKRTIKATFPEAYADRKLAGREGTFDVEVKSMASPDPFAIDDEFAKSLNFESLDKLKEMVRGNMANQY